MLLSPDGDKLYYKPEEVQPMMQAANDLFVRTRDERDTARAEVEKLKQYISLNECDRALYAFQARDEARAALAESLALLRECLMRLERDADHTPECLAEYEKPCICGRAALLQRIEAELKDK